MPKVYLEKRDCESYPVPDYYYCPSEFYPEYPFSQDTLSPERNEVYDMVRSSLFGMGLDRDRYGTSAWNPLGDFVQKDARIMLKPNWVNHTNNIGGLDCTVTHPSIIRCIIDYCCIAGASEIIIGDAPIQDCNLESLLETNNYNRMFSFFQLHNIMLSVLDFRVTHAQRLTRFPATYQQIRNSQQQTHKHLFFDLGTHSYHNSTNPAIYKIAVYHDEYLNLNHHDDTHVYSVYKLFFDMDLIINLPKPKTHRFAGLTGAQKNLVGVCPDKEFLPHYRRGTIKNGGDEADYLSVLGKINRKLHELAFYNMEKGVFWKQYVYKLISMMTMRLRVFDKHQKYDFGQWYGNDTIWRTILDINLIAMYGNPDGTIDFNGKPRSILTVGDLIIAGERAGPLTPQPKPLGIILSSDNNALFDYVFSKIAGSPVNCIPTVDYALKDSRIFINDSDTIVLNTNLEMLDGLKLEELSFPSAWTLRPSPYWDELFEIK